MPTFAWLLFPALALQGGDGWERDREAARALDAPAAALEALEEWRATILPGADELAWEAIPWIPSFADGVRRADAEGRPLLFWAMNGHPLGCT